MNFSFNKASGLKIPAGLQQTVFLMPLWQKLAIWVIAIVIPGSLFWFLYMSPRLEEMNTINGKIPKLKKEVAILEAKVKQMPQLEKELGEMEDILKQALRLLPEDKDIPAVLTEISSLGNEEHLEFLSFKPLPESKKDFYAAIPVQLQITGPFHNTMRFFDKVGSMARIVHIKEIHMGNARETSEVWSQKSTAGATGPEASRTGSERGRNLIISTSCKAVTYRFLTPEEQKAHKKKKNRKKKK